MEKIERCSFYLTDTIETWNTYLTTTSRLVELSGVIRDSSTKTFNRNIKISRSKSFLKALFESNPAIRDYACPIIFANTDPNGLSSPEKKNFVLLDKALAISS